MSKVKKIIEKKSEIKLTLLWLLEQSKGVRKYTVVFLIISLFSMLFSLASPVASKFVVDAAISPTQEFRFEYALIMLGTTLVSILLSSISNIFSGYVNEKFAFSVRAVMFDRTQRGSWKNISSFHSGDMLSRLTSDVDNIATNIVSLLPSLIITSIQLVIILIILLTVDPMLAVIGLIVGPVGLILATVYRKPYQKYTRTLRESQSEYYTFFQETLGNIDVIKAFQLEEKNNEYFSSLRERRMKTVMKSTKLSTLMSATMRLIYAVGYVVAFCWCASRIGSSPAYTYGTMTLFLTLVSQLQTSIRGLGGVIPTFYSMLVSAKRVRDITEQSREDTEVLKDMPKKVGLRVQNVTFSYNERKILDNINLDISPCERVGIVGESGAGKTTLIRLLLALVTPNEGNVIFTKGKDEIEYASPSSRRFISYVPQGNTLMTGTVRDNLLTGNPDATEEMMWDALKKADADNFIKDDERGLDMPIKEKSGGVSAGQAQRICIARALLRDRPVMIFDEATSALDENTERRVFEELSQDNNHSYFVITHRKSMLKYCTAILEVNRDGSIKYTKK